MGGWGVKPQGSFNFQGTPIWPGSGGPKGIEKEGGRLPGIWARGKKTGSMICFKRRPGILRGTKPLNFRVLRGLPRKGGSPFYKPTNRNFLGFKSPPFFDLPGNRRFMRKGRVWLSPSKRGGRPFFEDLPIWWEKFFRNWGYIFWGLLGWGAD